MNSYDHSGAESIANYSEVREEIGRSRLQQACRDDLTRATGLQESAKPG